MATTLISSPFPAAAEVPLGGFKAYELDTSRNPVPSDNRFGFYQVSLVSGHFVVECAGRPLELQGTYLIFASHRLPYSTLLLSAHVASYACLFTEDFVQDNSGLSNWHQSPLFQPAGLSVCQLNQDQASYCVGVFGQMLATQRGSYAFKGELLASYLQLLLHEGLRMQPSQGNLHRPQPTVPGTAPLWLG